MEKKENNKPGTKPGSRRVKPKDLKKGYAATLTESMNESAKKKYGTLGKAVELAVKYHEYILGKEKEIKEAIKKLENEL